MIHEVSTKIFCFPIGMFYSIVKFSFMILLMTYSLISNLYFPVLSIKMDAFALALGSIFLSTLQVIAMEHLRSDFLE